MRYWPKRRFERILLWVAIVFVVYSVGTWLGVPALVRYIAQNQVAAALERRVSVGKVTFNPYKLRFNVLNLHIRGREPSEPFVDIARVDLRLSWTSIYRLALVVKEITVDGPSIHLVRTGPRTFNFSDLIQPSPTPAKPAGQKHFAISNIQLNDGQILFDDHVLNQQHRLENIRLDVPFIANLPTDADIYVQPLLEMKVDGSPFAITGKTKPFGGNLESVINIGVQRLDLTRFTDYVPQKLPLKLTQAALSVAVQLHFVEATDQPKMRLTGTVTLDDVAVKDPANSPLVELKQLQVAMADVEPLDSIVHLSSISIDALTPHLVLKHDGTTNLTPILNFKPGTNAAPPAPVQSAPSQPANPAGINQAAPPNLSPAPSPGASPVASASMSPPATPIAPAPLQAASTPVAATPSASPSPALMTNPMLAAPPSSPAVPAASTAATAGNQLALSVDSLQMTNSAVDLNDQAGAVPVMVKLQAIHLGVANFASPGVKPASYDFGTNLGGGGQITATGNFDLKASQATAKVTLNAIDIPSLQGLAQSAVAATIVSGKLSAQATLRTGFAPGHFQLHAEPGGLTLDGFEVRAPNESQDVLGWKHFGVKLRQFDLGSRQAIVQEVSSDGLHVMVLREHGGQLNLASLLRTEPVNNQAARAAAGPQHHERRPRRRESTAARRAAARRTRVAQAKAKPVTPSAAGGWQYKVESIALDNTDATIEDQSQSHPLAMQIAALNLKLKDVTSDLAKPFAIQLEGRVNKKGVFKIAGEAAVDPLKARLRIDTRRVELASLDPFITSQLNAKITRAELNMNGEASAELRRGKIEAGYRGGITLGNVRILDKLTGESFLRWYALSLDRIDARYGAGEPRVRIGEIALSSFYARIILNANGRLNLRDVVSKPGEAPVSLTRERSATTNPAAPAPAPQSTPTPAATPPAGAPPAAAATPAPIPADIGIGGIKLQEGQINYTDDFIKPNYSADLTEVDGKVGAFGTRTTTPADVALSGKVNGDAPITITGAINPLAPMAAVDIKANAQGVELTPLAPYSTKYTGYPITDGTLTVDVHYLLANQQLTAQNHIVIDQLTFGDRAVNSSAANLPVRLAVALLKDRQGRIDLQIPISGSLSDPQFSIGGVIWHAVLNLVMKAVTSPFSLLASAIGGKAGQNLSYIEFSAGYATLTKAAQAKLETVAKALQQKTSLKLEITGRVDPKLDIPGLRAAMLEAAIKRAKSGKKDLTPAQIEQVKITPDQYDKYLWRVYKAADFEKPRDLMGLTKSLPPDQLKQAILAHTKVSDDDLRHLADARATAVAQALSGKIDAARVSTLAPKLNVDGVGAGSPTTIADMTLR